MKLAAFFISVSLYAQIGPGQYPQNSSGGGGGGGGGTPNSTATCAGTTTSCTISGLSLTSFDPTLTQCEFYVTGTPAVRTPITVLPGTTLTGSSPITAVTLNYSAPGSGDTVVCKINSSGSGGGTVAGVTASSPLASSGGATPNITITSPLPVINGGTGTTTPSLVAGTNVTVTGSFPNQTVSSTAGGTVTGVTASSPLASSGGSAPNISITSPLPVANGGTGTPTPSLVAGTNVTITGSFPNQTVNSTGGIIGIDPCTDATGSTTAYVCTSVNGQATTNDKAFLFKPQTTNTTTTPTLTINGTIWALKVQKAGVVSNPAVGDFLGGQWYLVTSDGVFWNVTGRVATDGGSSGGGVSAVTGTSPIMSSGGSTPAISCPTCGVGTVTNSGTLTSTNIMVGAGTTVITASSPTIDSSGNISTPGSVSAGVGGPDTGGFIAPCATQVIPSTPTNGAGVIAPASCTGQIIVQLPATGATGAGQVLASTGAASGGVTPTSYQAPYISSITATGSSGPATVVSGVLNVPQYSGGGGGGAISVQSADLGGAGTNVRPLNTVFHNATSVPIFVSINCYANSTGTGMVLQLVSDSSSTPVQQINVNQHSATFVVAGDGFNLSGWVIPGNYYELHDYASNCASASYNWIEWH